MSQLDATTSPASEEHPLPPLGLPSAFLKVVWSADREPIGRRIPLDDELLLIGREQSDRGIAVRDPKLSRAHARFYYDMHSAGMRIGDAQSRNGTFVNMRLVKSALLCPGDVIRIGNTVLVYEERDLLAELRSQAAVAARIGANVLLRGETGTGKELLARELHAQSGRGGAFVPINCGSVPIELLSTELFGHTRQAFSGATHARKGLFVDAAGGTLFLDEVGDCPMPIQIALLRALQEKAVRPVGSERELAVDVRVIAATHQDLASAMARGAFRADLFARLSQVSLTLPPLRERRGQVLELIETFAGEYGHTLQLTADVVEALLCWDWPLNVRELQAFVHMLVVRGNICDPLGLAQLRELSPRLAEELCQRRAGSDCASQGAPSPAVSSAARDRQRVRALLATHAGNVSAVAQELGKPRSHVYRWLKTMGLSAGKFRK